MVWVGVGWCGLVWVGVGWCGLVCVGVGWCGLVWVGVGWCGWTEGGGVWMSGVRSREVGEGLDRPHPPHRGLPHFGPLPRSTTSVSQTHLAELEHVLERQQLLRCAHTAAVHPRRHLAAGPPQHPHRPPHEEHRLRQVVADAERQQAREHLARGQVAACGRESAEGTPRSSLPAIPPSVPSSSWRCPQVALEIASPPNYGECRILQAITASHVPLSMRPLPAAAPPERPPPPVS